MTDGSNLLDSMIFSQSDLFIIEEEVLRKILEKPEKHKKNARNYWIRLTIRTTLDVLNKYFVDNNILFRKEVKPDGK